MSDMVVHGQDDYSVHYKGTFALGLEFFDVSFYNLKYGVNEKYSLQGLVSVYHDDDDGYLLTYVNGSVLIFCDDRGWEMIFNPEKVADGMYVKSMHPESTHLEVYFTHSAAFGILLQEQLGVMYNNFA
jgi:hypothetical protein